MIINFQLRLFFLVSLFCCVSVFKPSVTCIFGKDKCPGTPEDNYFSITNHVAPFLVFNAESDENCSITCYYSSRCWVAAVDKQVCQLYPKEAKVMRDGSTHMYVWWCCKDDQNCQQQQGRCRGYWVNREWTGIEGVRVIRSFQVGDNIPLCKDQCLKTLTCGAINYKEKNICELLQYATSYPVSKTFNKSVNSYEWHCCPPKPNLPDKCRSVSGKCSGRWKILPQAPTESHHIAGELRNITSVSECMAVCETNPFCSKAFVNQTWGICLLMSDRPALANGTQCDGYKWVLRHNFTWFGYSWECCQPGEDPLQPEDPNTPSKLGDCICLMGNGTQELELASDGCTEPLLGKTVVLTSELAAMWRKEELEVTVDGQAWSRLFNGEKHLWVSLSSAELTKCPSQHCHQYSPLIPDTSCPEIVARTSWFARPPKKPLDIFSTTPTVVSVSNTVCPRAGCYSEFACGNYLRTMQIYPTLPERSFDLPFNFLIGEDGRVYEGRGADYVGAHTGGYNSISIGIAFIGWYEKRRPSVSSLVAVRRLLHCLVSRGNLTRTYELFGHRDLRPSVAPGFFLYHLLPNWGHYTDHFLPAGLDCDALRARATLQRFSILSSCVLLCILLISGSVLYAKVLSHATWCPQRRPARTRTRIFASAGREDVLTRNLNALPAQCTVRPATRLQVPPHRSLVLLTPRDPCPCSHAFRLLWARCAARGDADFPARLHASAMSRQCRRSTVLLLTDRLFLFHGDATGLAVSAAKNECVCSRREMQTGEAEGVKVEGMKLFRQENLLLKQRELRETGIKEAGVAKLCRLVDDDLTFDDFEKDQPPDYEQAVEIDISQQSGLNVTSLLL